MSEIVYKKVYLGELGLISGEDAECLEICFRSCNLKISQRKTYDEYRIGNTEIKVPICLDRLGHLSNRFKVIYGSECITIKAQQ